MIAVAKRIADMSAFKLLVIDSENKLVATGFAQQIALAGKGRYHYLPGASAKAMELTAKEAIKED